MNLRQLGIFTMCTAPAFAIVLGLGAKLDVTPASRLVGAILTTLFLLGWMAAVVGLRELGSSGKTWLSEFLLNSQFFTLSLAILFNFYQALSPTPNPLILNLTNLGWPLSNLLLLGTGIVVALGSDLPGWKRFVPLACGLLSPAWIFWGMLLGENAAFVAAIHSMVTWWLFGYVIFDSETPRDAAKPAKDEFDFDPASHIPPNSNPSE